MVVVEVVAVAVEGAVVAVFVSTLRTCRVLAGMGVTDVNGVGSGRRRAEVLMVSGVEDVVAGDVEAEDDDDDDDEEEVAPAFPTIVVSLLVAHMAQQPQLVVKVVYSSCLWYG